MGDFNNELEKLWEQQGSIKNKFVTRTYLRTQTHTQQQQTTTTTSRRGVPCYAAPLSPGSLAVRAGEDGEGPVRAQTATRIRVTKTFSIYLIKSHLWGNGFSSLSQKSEVTFLPRCSDRWRVAARTRCHGRHVWENSRFGVGAVRSCTSGCLIFSP
jgi:hypothetical protein